MASTAVNSSRTSCSPRGGVVAEVFALEKGWHGTPAMIKSTFGRQRRLDGRSAGRIQLHCYIVAHQRRVNRYYEPQGAKYGARSRAQIENTNLFLIYFF
eukprot:scaffold101_cov567-Pavlova_lutheri.AAC.4